tara:strand:- start:29542 stop:29703 length:162 start_codon:yes stop_codon:yes gene_type:complete
MEKFIIIVMLLVGNFAYQLMAEHPDWETAFERSYFQAIAIALIIWLPPIIRTS